MIFIGGVGGRVKPAGSARGSCLACGRQTALHTCKKYSVVTLFFVPIIPFGTEYIATCPHCASVMAIPKAQGRALEQNGEIHLQPSDLILLQDNHGPSCPHCGEQVRPGHSFCPSCGSRL